VVKYPAGRFVSSRTLALFLGGRGNRLASELVSDVVPPEEASGIEHDATELSKRPMLGATLRAGYGSTEFVKKRGEVLTLALS